MNNLHQYVVTTAILAAICIVAMAVSAILAIALTPIADKKVYRPEVAFLVFFLGIWICAVVYIFLS